MDSTKVILKLKKVKGFKMSKNKIDSFIDWIYGKWYEFKLEYLPLILIITGIILGLYAGLWWAFIGGIMIVIEEVANFPEISSIDFALGIARVFFAGVIGWAVALIFIIPGLNRL